MRRSTPFVVAPRVLNRSRSRRIGQQPNLKQLQLRVSPAADARGDRRITNILVFTWAAGNVSLSLARASEEHVAGAPTQWSLNQEVREMFPLSCTLFVWTVVAAVAVPAPTQVTGLPEGTWYVDTRASRVFVHVYATGLGHEHGVRGVLKEGKIEFGPGVQGGELVFDMRRFYADGPDARRAVGLRPDRSVAEQREVTQIMLGPDILDVAHYPTARYQIRSLEPTKPRTSWLRDARVVYRIGGQLTLHGTTRPLSFEAGVYPTNQPDRLVLRGGFRLLQSHYGIRPYTRLFGAIGVADHLDIYGVIVLRKPAVRAARKERGR